MKISKRLRRIADFVPAGSRVADIGTDHALLPLYLVSRGSVPWAIAGELRKGPLLTAKSHVERRGFQERIAVRQGNGLAVIAPGEVDVVILAGMGGQTVCEILAAGKEKLTFLRRMILQPQGDVALVRQWLVENGWKIQDEDLVLEDHQFYPILVAEPGHGQPLTAVERELGPVLLKKRLPLFWEWIDKEKEKIHEIMEKLGPVLGERAEARRRELLQRKRWLEEVMEDAGYGQKNYGDHGRNGAPTVGDGGGSDRFANGGSEPRS